MDLKKLAADLTPMIAQRLVVTPALFGDPARVKLAPNLAPNNCLFNTSSGEIRVEEDVCFGHNVCLLTGTHDIRKKGRDRITSFPDSGHDIVVRKGAWLSSNVTVLGPCEIGENAVIAAGSVVLDDVRPDSLYAGTPARFIKSIEYDED